MTIEEGDLRLRPIQLPRDIDLGLPWYQDPEVLWMSEGTREPYDRSRVQKMYEYLGGKGEGFIIEKLEKGSWIPIGDAFLCHDCIPIVIGRSQYRSKGLGKRILGLLISRARKLGWAELNVNEVYPHNERARRLFLNAGFIRDDRLETGDEKLKFYLKL